MPRRDGQQRRRPFYAVCQFGSQVIFATLFRGRVFGRHHVPRAGGVLLVCNHQSFFDPIVATLALPRPCHFMARDTLFRNRHFRRLIESVNAFPIKRGTTDVTAIKETLRRLKRGCLVTTFPEGTRTRDGNVGPMQSGVILLARKARVPIVPALVLGAFEAWPRHAPLPRPRPILVAYGEPMSVELMSSLDSEECIGEVRSRIIALAERYHTHSLLTEC